MKATIAYVISILSILTIVSCSASLSSDNSKVSYGIGTQFGNDMKNRGMELDMKAFNQAVKDVYNGEKSRLSDDDFNNAYQRVSLEMMKKQTKMADENAKVGKEYLDKNKSKPGVKVTASGLQYKIIKEGTGFPPRATDMVKVHYRGKLIDGTEFDSSYKRHEPAEFPLNRVIPGWTEGLQLMKVGSKYQLVIPSDLGYGERGNERIPGNSVLIFDVELLEIKGR